MKILLNVIKSGDDGVMFLAEGYPYLNHLNHTGYSIFTGLVYLLTLIAAISC